MTNVDLDKRFVPGDLLSLGQRSSTGKEFHSIGAEYLKDWFWNLDSSTRCDCRTVESDEFRRSGGARLERYHKLLRLSYLIFYSFLDLLL